MTLGSCNLADAWYGLEYLQLLCMCFLLMLRRCYEKEYFTPKFQIFYSFFVVSIDFSKMHISSAPCEENGKLQG